MLPINVLTIALLGGYIFVNNWYYTKYSVLRSDGHRLLFRSAIAAIIFLAASHVFVLILNREPFTYVGHYWGLLFPYEYSGRIGLSFILSFVSYILLNKLGDSYSVIRTKLKQKIDINPSKKHQFLKFREYLYSKLSKEYAVEKEILEKNDPMEILLRESLGTSRMVSITAKNRKVYIGKILSTINPAFKLESISIFISYSGHRKQDTMEVSIDRDNATIIKKIENEFIEKQLKILIENNPGSTIEQIVNQINTTPLENELLLYRLIIPITEIQHANFFDKTTYDKYYKQEPVEKDLD